jgi:hypothetical protein
MLFTLFRSFPTSFSVIKLPSALSFSLSVSRCLIAAAANTSTLSSSGDSSGLLKIDINIWVTLNKNIFNNNVQSLFKERPGLSSSPVVNVSALTKFEFLQNYRCKELGVLKSQPFKTLPSKVIFLSKKTAKLLTVLNGRKF